MEELLQHLFLVIFATTRGIVAHPSGIFFSTIFLLVGTAMLCARLQYLHCWCTVDTAVFHYTIKICTSCRLGMMQHHCQCLQMQQGRGLIQPTSGVPLPAMAMVKVSSFKVSPPISEPLRYVEVGHASHDKIDKILGLLFFGPKSSIAELCTSYLLPPHKGSLCSPQYFMDLILAKLQ